MADLALMPSELPKELLALSEVKQVLAEIVDLTELKAIRDKAEAITHYASGAGLGLHATNLAAEVTIQCERRAGSILRTMDLRGGDRKSKCPTFTLNKSASLKDFGISKKQSASWQRESDVPDEVFDAHVRQVKAAGRQLTRTGVLKLARQQAKPPAPNGEMTTESRRQHVRERGLLISNLSEISGERFGCIYADPPWAYDNHATRASAEGEYAGTMTVDELCAMPIANLAADDAHLHLWTTNAFLPESFRLISAWGFEYKSCFVWVKPQLGIGNYWRVSHEFMLLGVRGNATRFAVKKFKSWLLKNRGRHSAKPEQVRQMVEAASPSPYLELFGRKRVTGWTVFGNQIDPQDPLF